VSDERESGSLRSVPVSVSCRVSHVVCDGVLGFWGPWRVSGPQLLAGQAVGIKEVRRDIWLVSFMDYDLGYFDLETRVLEPIEDPFGPRLLPM
jgi:hypothetical protein